MASRVINISLPDELLRAVDQVARQEKRTRSELFREAARRYIQQAGEASFTTADRKTFARLSAATFNRIWDNPVDAELWDAWETEQAN